MTNHIRSGWTNPIAMAIRAVSSLREQMRTNVFCVMAAVVCVLLIKVVCKIGIGMPVHSQTLMGDGIHNIGDAFENILIIVVLVISKRPRSQEYSMGRGNMEFVASGALALLLFWVVLDFGRNSLAGLAFAFRPVAAVFDWLAFALNHVPLVGPWLVDMLSVHSVTTSEIAGPLFPIVLAVGLLSFVLSMIFARYQIKVGTLTGHRVVVASGEEMKADSKIELVTLVAIVSEKLFPSQPWIEYACALVVAGFISITAKELFMEALRALLAKSLGGEIDERLRAMCLNLPGVNEVVALGTFRVGPLAVVKVSLNTLCEGAMPLLTETIEEQLSAYVAQQGFLEVQVDVMIKRPLTSHNHRIGYAVMCTKLSDADAFGGREYSLDAVAATIESATHIAVVDMEFGDPERITLHRLADEVGADVEAFLLGKRVETLYVFDEERQRETWKSENVSLNAAVSYMPLANGLEDELLA